MEDSNNFPVQLIPPDSVFVAKDHPLCHHRHYSLPNDDDKFAICLPPGDINS